MKISYLILWAAFIVAYVVASDKHEDKLELRETTDRKGWWEMLWFGCACCAVNNVFGDLVLNIIHLFNL